MQLLPLDEQKNSLRSELDNKKLLERDRAKRLIELVRLYKEQIEVGISEINAIQENDKRRDWQFKFRRKIVDSIDVKVLVSSDKSIRIMTELDLPSLVTNNMASTFLTTPMPI